MMLLVVAFIASITMTCAETMACDEKFLKNFNEFFSEFSKLSAELRNANLRTEFTRQQTSYKDEIAMVPVKSSNKAKSKNADADLLTLKMSDGKYGTFPVSSFGFTITTHKNGLEVIASYIRFQRKGAAPVLLEIPLVDIPSKLATAEKEELESWAGGNNVGLIPPVNIQQLKAIRENKQITLEFNWLKDLLLYGVYGDNFDFNQLPNKKGPSLEYNTRPIAVPEGLIKNIKDIVRNY